VLVYGILLRLHSATNGSSMGALCQQAERSIQYASESNTAGTGLATLLRLSAWWNELPIGFKVMLIVVGLIVLICIGIFVYATTASWNGREFVEENDEEDQYGS